MPECVRCGEMISGQVFACGMFDEKPVCRFCEEDSFHRILHTIGDTEDIQYYGQCAECGLGEEEELCILDKGFYTCSRCRAEELRRRFDAELELFRKALESVFVITDSTPFRKVMTWHRD